MIELASLLILVILAWIAGSKASTLVYSPSIERLQRKTRKLLNWIGYLSLFTLAVLTSIVLMVRTFDSVIWIDRVIFHVPFLAVPLLMLWFTSVPKLWKLRRHVKENNENEENGDTPLSPEIGHITSHTKLIVPFQMSALGAFAALYFLLVPPIPFKLPDVAIPVLLLLLAIFLLWWSHSRRSEKIGLSDAPVINRPLIRAVRNLGILVVIFVVTGVFFFINMQNSLLPSKLDMMAGPADYGGGTLLSHYYSEASGHEGHNTDSSTYATSAVKTVSVTDLAGSISGVPDRQFTLTAEKKTAPLSSDEEVDLGRITEPFPALNYGLRKVN